jgi:hypothetical protein
VEKWEYNVVVTYLATGLGVEPNIAKAWEMQGHDGLTDWSRIQRLGAEGWEMVNVFTLAGAANMGTLSYQVVWVFKRKAA